MESHVNEMLEAFSNKDSLSLDEKINKLLKFNAAMGSHLMTFETKIEERLSALETSVNSKVESLTEDVDNLKSATNENKVRADNNAAEIVKLRQELESHVSDVKKKAVLRDLKSREHNLVIGNIPDGNAWETRERSMQLVRKFLKDLFAINSQKNDNFDPNTIVIEDAHRIPQNPTTFFQTNENGRRKMVIRVSTILEKQLILKRCVDLKVLNLNKTKYEKLFVDKHYPKEMQDQQKILRPKFNEFRKNKVKVKFSVDFNSAQLCIKDDKNNLTFAKDIPPPTQEPAVE